MKAKSIKGKSSDQIQSALKESMADGFRPTLALLFISIKQDRKAICEILHKEGIEFLGATSSGEFIDGYQDEGSAVVLLLDLNPDSYTILFEAVNGRDLNEVAAQIAQDALHKFKRPALILCSTSLSVKGEMLNGEVLVRSIENVVGPQVNIFG